MDRLLPESSLLLVVDVQERLLGAMSELAQTRLLKNIDILLEAAKLLGVRVIASEQYPKGLGPTVRPVLEKLQALGVSPLAKLDFDALGDPSIARAVSQTHPRSVVVVGMETHVCVFQTARELARRGYATHVVGDAVASRTEDNREVGLRLSERAGATVTVTETVVFDWLKCAGTEAFKQLSKQIR
jgi:nicotinamidase-related amidase